MQNKHTMIPSPEVQHLTTIFRRIQNGDIRVPAFQRNFVWEASQVAELLESIYKGYPIGSVLFWKVSGSDGISLNTVDSSTSNASNTPVPFPQNELVYPTNFVIDGMQRLSALYGVFFAPSINYKYNVLFDLQKKEFVFRNSLQTVKPHMLSLSDLFIPRQLIQAQQQMAVLKGGEGLIDESITLLTAFQEYMLPIVTIASADVTEVVEIFERVNRTGSKLSRFHFMRALTWSGNFDLTQAVEELQAAFNETSFKFSPDTLTKIIAVQLGKNPNPKSMLEMRQLDALKLQEGVEKAKQAIRLTIIFLQDACGVYSSVFVPYEGQTIVLSKLFGEVASPPHDVLEIVRRWFWNTSLSEALRGKPDSYVTRDIDALMALLNGNKEALSERMLLDESTILERRFTRQKALSSAIVGLFSHKQARSLFTGDIIYPIQYNDAFMLENVQSIVSYDTVKDVVKRRISSAKVLANILVTTEDDRRLLESSSLKETIQNLKTLHGDLKANEILESQLISTNAFVALQQDNERTFLIERAKTILKVALEMTGTASSLPAE